jgi:hypothetical protein
VKEEEDEESWGQSHTEVYLKKRRRSITGKKA